MDDRDKKRKKGKTREDKSKRHKSKKHKSKKHRSKKESGSGRVRRDVAAGGRSRTDQASIGDDVQGAGGKPVSITEDHYFLLNSEFSVWLHQERGKRFADLNSKAQRKEFAQFSREWNGRSLPPMYYGTIPEACLEQARHRTKHTWGFTKRLTEQEKLEIGTLRDSVVSASARAATVRSKLPGSNVRGPICRPVRVDPADAEELRERSRALRKADLKRQRQRQRLVEEELVPKETGRERLLQKRKETGAKIHGAARQADADRDGLDLSESRTFGGGGSSEFREEQARRQAWKRRKTDEKLARVEAARHAEAAKMQAFMDQMGLKPGARITIAARKPGE